MKDAQSVSNAADVVIHLAPLGMVGALALLGRRVARETQLLVFLVVLGAGVAPAPRSTRVEGAVAADERAAA